MTIVSTPLGQLQGEALDGYERFLGIRYAEPPVGDLRFRPPVPVGPWEGVRDATRFGPASVQPPPAPGGSFIGGADMVSDEDCLFVNVYTPGADDRRRPVMVWIHGGAYTMGSGQTYDGSRFMHGDVVVVTVNYRLGVLGWMGLDHLDPSYAGSGNNGIRDLVAALEWVRDNIAAFGGDPDDVTIFGESAGGGCVFALLATPAADGLFSKAIAQSGVPGFGPPRGQDQYADAILSAIGAPGGGIEALLRASAADLLAAQTAQGAFERWGTGEDHPLDGSAPGPHPTVDGVVVTRTVREALASKGGRNVPLIVGTNAHEGTLFGAMLPGSVTDEQLAGALRGLSPQPERVLAAMRAAATGRPLLTDLFTEAVFHIPSLHAADAQAGTDVPVWVYQFTWETPVFGGTLGATHALEIPFVFDSLDDPMWKMFVGDSPPRQLAKVMHETWIAFARTGVPAHPDLPEWPPYETATRPTMEIGEKCGVVLDPGGDIRAAWMDERPSAG